MGEGETISIPAPTVRLALGITGHRAGHPAWAANHPAIAALIAALFDRIEAVLTQERAALGATAPPRLHGLMADGADQLTAAAALARGWELVAPLPFGRALNLAINAHPPGLSDAQALLFGGHRDRSCV